MSNMFGGPSSPKVSPAPPMVDEAGIGAAKEAERRRLAQLRRKAGTVLTKGPLAQVDTQKQQVLGM